MESIFANDTTEDLKEMRSSTRKQRNELQLEIDSCQDCIDEITEELEKRE